ncbi:MAG: hypothetical protein AB1714_16160 [Acidobacteriota bacterium]
MNRRFTFFASLFLFALLVMMASPSVAQVSPSAPAQARPFSDALVSIQETGTGLGSTPSSVHMAALQAEESPDAGSTERQWTKGGKIMTVIGLAVAGAGAVMVATWDEPTEAGTHIDWQTTGYVWIGAGAVLAIIGLTRRR